MALGAATVAGAAVVLWTATPPVILEEMIAPSPALY